MTKERTDTNIAVNILIYKSSGHTAFSPRFGLKAEGRLERQPHQILVFLYQQNNPNLFDWIGSVTVFCACRPVWMFFFFFLLSSFYSYICIYAGCPKFSPNAADVLTHPTCYVINNTLIKDATLYVWLLSFIHRCSTAGFCLFCCSYVTDGQWYVKMSEKHKFWCVCVVFHIHKDEFHSAAAGGWDAFEEIRWGHTSITLSWVSMCFHHQSTGTMTFTLWLALRKVEFPTNQVAGLVI